MDIQRLRTGEWLTAAGGLVLFVSLFLPWFGVEGFSNSAWEVFSVTDLIFCLFAIVGIVSIALAAADRTLNIPVGMAGVTID